MLSIRRRKGGRSCFIAGESERTRTKGGRWNVGIATPCRTRGGGSRGATVAARSVSDSESRACNGRDAARAGGGRAVLARRVPLAGGGSGAPVAASTAASSRSEHATGVTRGRAGVASAQNVPRARAGAAARPLRAKHGRFIAVRACKGRDAARVEGGSRAALDLVAGKGGRSARDALPNRRGREPRRDRCGRCTAASRGASVQGA